MQKRSNCTCLCHSVDGMIHCVPCCDYENEDKSAVELSLNSDITFSRSSCVANTSLLFPQTVVFYGSNGSSLVTFHLDDGRWEFGENYDPGEAAKAFLSYVAQEYNEFLKWKKSRG